MNTLSRALQYLAMGWSILPIKQGEKIPAISTWTEFTKRKPTMSEVTQWFTQMPKANIAVICGEISGIICVDIDSGKGEPDLLNLELPPTLSSRTGGGGMHVIYKWRKGLVGAKVGIRKFVDIRSDNSYIVLPDSLHVSGNKYKWINEGDEITEAPKWLESDADQNPVKEPTDWDKFLSADNAIGLRNAKAAQVAGKIMFEMSSDMWNSMGVMMFRGWNEQYNKPKLSEKELSGVWESIKKTHIKNLKKSNKELPIPEDELSIDEQEEYIKKGYVKNKTQGSMLLASYIVKKYNIITVGEFERELFVYRDGIYKRAENEVIYPEIQRLLGNEVTKNAKTETFHKITDMTHHPREVFESADNRFIPLANGVYDLEDDVLLPHDPKYRFKFKSPVIYSADAKSPLTEAFFEQILSPEQCLIIEEWLGYYFYRNYMFKKAIIFVGEGDTGKTTLLEVITFLLGRTNLSSVALQKMASDKFSAAHLYEKHGNLVDELSPRDISDTGAFKIATGGGSITGEYKFGNQFSFVNYSKFTFACNKIPDVKDTDDLAYFNRWMVIHFENTITKKIPNFIKTLTTEEERSGLFNLAMKGLRRLLQQEHFTYNKSGAETKLEMMRGGSSIAMFVSDMIIKEDGAITTKEDMYNAYVAFCNDNNLTRQTDKTLGMKLTDYANFIIDSRTRDTDGKGIRVWRNVKLKVVVKPVEIATKVEDKGFGDYDNIQPDEIDI